MMEDESVVVVKDPYRFIMNLVIDSKNAECGSCAISSERAAGVGGRRWFFWGWGYRTVKLEE